MVYKFRNKSLFWTLSGYKNNYRSNVLLMPTDYVAQNLYAMKTYQDHHSFLRAHQLYRNMSRTCKQYLYGDKHMEERFTVALKNWFTVPLTSETPTHLLKYGGERRFVDQGERDFELMSYNQHPYQLKMYQVHNDRVLKANDTEKKKEDEQFEAMLEEALKEEQSTLKAGDKIDIERYSEIFFEVFRIHEKNLETKHDSTSNYEDYTEIRNARPDIHTH